MKHASEPYRISTRQLGVPLDLALPDAKMIQSCGHRASGHNHSKLRSEGISIRWSWLTHVRLAAFSTRDRGRRVSPYPVPGNAMQCDEDEILDKRIGKSV